VAVHLRRRRFRPRGLDSGLGGQRVAHTGTGFALAARLALADR